MTVKIQIIARDYNGSTSIIDTVGTIHDAVQKIKGEVSDSNFNNALTTDNKFKSIEAYYPEFDNKNIMYAGNSSDGNHRVWDNNSLRMMSESDVANFYIGSNEGQEFFLKTWQDQPIHDFNHELLDDKTYFYINVIEEK